MFDCGGNELLLLSMGWTTYGFGRAQNSNPSQPVGAINIADAQFRSEISGEDEPAFSC